MKTISLFLALFILVSNVSAYVIHPGVPVPKMDFMDRFPAKDTEKDWDEEVKNFVELSYHQLQRTLLIEKDVVKIIRDLRFIRSEILNYQVYLVLAGVKRSKELSLADRWYPHLGVLDKICKYWLSRFERVVGNQSYYEKLLNELESVRVLYNVTDVQFQVEMNRFVSCYKLFKDLESQIKSEQISTMDFCNRWTVKGQVDMFMMVADKFFAKSVLNLIFILNLMNRYDVDEQKRKVFSYAVKVYDMKQNMLQEYNNKLRSLQKKER